MGGSNPEIHTMRKTRTAERYQERDFMPTKNRSCQRQNEETASRAVGKCCVKRAAGQPSQQPQRFDNEDRWNQQ